MAGMTFREDDVRRERDGRFAAQQHSAPEPGLLAGIGRHRRAAKAHLDRVARVRAKLSDADLRALDSLPHGTATSVKQFQRTAFRGLFKGRQAGEAMSRLAAAGAIEVYDYSTTWSPEKLQIIRLV